ncbi:MAG: RNA methyltransferase [Firmicutes bacterium]|jgi:TrmH family RNA methyltransferase|nr:RNA methyltransferase [Bacillota bacterium]MDH7496080.1 RNA methyltransferase [Bacillota bacterium]
MITSRRNPRVQEIRKLGRREHRAATRRFLLEGARSIEEAVDAGARMHEALVTPHLLRVETGRTLVERLEAAGTQVIEVTEEVLAAVSDTETPQGIVAVAEIPGGTVNLSGNPLVLVVDGVKDPGNLGTLIRTAAALGVAGVITTRGTVDAYNPKCVRATMGSLFRIPIEERTDSLEAVSVLRTHGLSVVAGDVRSGTPCYEWDFTGPSAVLVGGEAFGPSESALETCDGRVRIPMPGGVESLNVAVAGAILMYEAVRQRGAGRGGCGAQAG